MAARGDRRNCHAYRDRANSIADRQRQRRPQRHTYVTHGHATPTPTLTPSSTPTPSPTPELAALVSEVRLNVRSGPGLVFPIVTVLPPGSTLRVAAQSSDLAWWNVCCLADGSSGWISAAYVLIGSGLPPPGTPAP